MADGFRSRVDGGKFSGRINLALEDQTGNSESTELDVDATLRYRRRWSEFESFGQVEYDTANDQSTADKWTLNNKYTRFFPKDPLARRRVAALEK